VLGKSEATKLCLISQGELVDAKVLWQDGMRQRAAHNFTTVAAAPVERAEDPPGVLGRWLAGGFRKDMPFAVEDYYGYVTGAHVFVMLWAYCFTQASLVMVVAGAVGAWYFRAHGEPFSGAPIVRSLLRFLSFHTGTAAFAGFAVAFCWFVRLAFEWASRKLLVLRSRARLPLPPHLPLPVPRGLQLLALGAAWTRPPCEKATHLLAKGLIYWPRVSSIGQGSQGRARGE